MGIWLFVPSPLPAVVVLSLVSIGCCVMCFPLLAVVLLGVVSCVMYSSSSVG